MSTAQSPVVLLVQRSGDDALDMYAEFLGYHGLTPIAVSNARDALMLAPTADIVVTGVILDDYIDGVQLVSRLRHDDRTKHTPIVVLTACVWDRCRERAEQAGCDLFLPKPCLPNDLLREVRLLLAASYRGNGSAERRNASRTSATVEGNAEPEDVIQSSSRR